MCENTVHPSKTVFLVGFPRSGTTWLGKLYDSHPDTVYRHEPFGREYSSFGIELYRKIKFGKEISRGERIHVVQTLIRALPNTSKPPFFRKSYRFLHAPRVESALWSSAKFGRIPAAVYQSLYTPRRGSPVLVVKETASDVVVRGAISSIKPDKVILIIRHPYEVIASHVVGVKSGKLPLSTPEDRLQWIDVHPDLAQHREAILGMSEVEFLAFVWRVQNESYLNFRCDQMTVLYESLVRDSQDQIDKLLQFSGLEMHRQVEAFIQSSTRGSSADYFSVYKKRSANGWRLILTDEDISKIDGHAASLCAQLGLSLSE